MAKLENKTREISQMLNNLNKISGPAAPVKRKNEQKERFSVYKTSVYLFLRFLRLPPPFPEFILSSLSLPSGSKITIIYDVILPFAGSPPLPGFSHDLNSSTYILYNPYAFGIYICIEDRV